MASLNEQILRTSKEIVVKFIEVGRVSPTSFPDVFKTVYHTIKETVMDSAPSEQPDIEKKHPKGEG